MENRYQIGKDRYYRCQICGEDHPSVTTLLDCISNPALGYWLEKNGTKKLIHFSNQIENYLEEDLYEKAKKEAEKTWVEKEKTAFWKSGKETGKEAADFGTIAHAAIESHIHGNKVDVKSLPDVCQRSFMAYLDFEKNHKVKVIETEKTFYGCQFNVAGTADFVGYIDGELTIMDHKTSSSIYMSYIIQTWIYALCDELTGNRLYKQIAVGRWGKDGESEFRIFKRNEFPSIEDARKILIACGDIFRVQKEWERKFPYIKKEKNNETTIEKN